MVASREIELSVEDRLTCLEEFVHQIWSFMRQHDWPPLCPYCENQEMFWAEGVEKEVTRAHRETQTWRCPKCGFFINTSRRIDPESLRWVDSKMGKLLSKPQRSIRHRLKKV